MERIILLVGLLLCFWCVTSALAGDIPEKVADKIREIQATFRGKRVGERFRVPGVDYDFIKTEDRQENGRRRKKRGADNCCTVEEHDALTPCVWPNLIDCTTFNCDKCGDDKICVYLWPVQTPIRITHCSCPHSCQEDVDDINCLVRPKGCLPAQYEDTWGYLFCWTPGTFAGLPWCFHNIEHREISECACKEYN